MTDETNVDKENTGKKKEKGKKKSTDHGIFRWLVTWRKLPGPIPPLPEHLERLFGKQIFLKTPFSVSTQPEILTAIKAHPDEGFRLKSLTNIYNPETVKIELVCSQPKTAYRVLKAIDLGVTTEAVDLPDFKE